IIFENLFGPYFLPHQSHSYGYAPSSGENLTSKMSFKSDATYYFHITLVKSFSYVFRVPISFVSREFFFLLEIKTAHWLHSLCAGRCI
ncbi:MAG: hypothetical protein PUJ30_04985, partial [Bacteroidales bacterium]|nr:hypothetical protein [Bacteroidales bacterium]MDY4620374.1 hypothetical protein [Alloprevotella sp.]